MLQAAIAAAPDYAEAYNNLGVLQREVGAIKVRVLGYLFGSQVRNVLECDGPHCKDALQMLQAAIAAAPDYAEAYNNLGVLQREVRAIKVRALARIQLLAPN